MDAISNYLRDPGWWFSAFFVAIVASVIAGFLKDRIERALPNWSATFSAWRTRRADERAKLVESLTHDHFLMTIAYIRAALGLVLYVLTLLLFFMTTIFEQFRPYSGEVVGIDRHFISSEILIPLLGGLATVQGFRASARISLVGRAWKIFSRRNNVPKMP